jgi:hypothetical protein
VGILKVFLNFQLLFYRIPAIMSSGVKLLDEGEPAAAAVGPELGAFAGASLGVGMPALVPAVADEGSAS